jgi:hypothetical protein
VTLNWLLPKIPRVARLLFQQVASSIRSLR